MRTRTTLSLLLCMLVLAVTANASPVHLWSHIYGDSDDQFVDACFTDPSGNIIMVGSFYGTINMAGCAVAQDGSPQVKLRHYIDKTAVPFRTK
jgi:hypothetical protein